MANVITVEEVKALAKANYTKGGDTIVECFDDKQIQEYITGVKKPGNDYWTIKPHKTEASWKKLFKFYYEMDREMQGWY